ncbi:elongation factor P [candidate division WOR-3 bacterium]|nr:elongation factor P [candidate division WOR-3 bacterium]
MADTSDIRKGLTIELDGQIFKVVEFLHVKPGKGQAFVRTKLKNVETGAVIEKTFKTGTTIYPVRLEERPAQFIYKEGDNYVFMDMETYENYPIPCEEIQEETKYLKEGLEVSLLFAKDRIVGVKLPNFVVLEIVETDPGIRGDTAQGGSKPARLETGAVVTVPLFVETGEKIKIDTRTGDYIERVKE